MNTIIKTSIIFFILCIISQIMIFFSDNALFTQQKTQESKINISIKLLLELFIVSTILYYIITKLNSLIYKNVKYCNEFIVVLLCTLFTIIVFSKSNMKNKLKYLFKNNTEEFNDGIGNNLNTTWRNIDNKHYIFNKPTKEYWNKLEKKK